MALMRRTQPQMDWPSVFGHRPFEWPESWRDLTGMEPELKVEEFQDDGQLVIRAEIPGIDPDKDVEITVSDNTLHLHAERRSESRSEDAKGYRSEFHYGSFSRALRLPVGATDADIAATYVDGILEVRVPIDTAKAEAKKIPISHG